jgi:hypothetical protein
MLLATAFMDALKCWSTAGARDVDWRRIGEYFCQFENKQVLLLSCADSLLSSEPEKPEMLRYSADLHKLFYVVVIL